jgi:2-polyprenyl-3-methyl-5-hydroxy-6-metoxy-1,4-benzoquinol methylase
MNGSIDNYPYIEKKHSWSSHWYIRRWLTACKNGTKILDVGTASGILGRALSGSGFQLTGLEPDVKWSQMARPYYQIFWEGRIEDAPSEIIGGQDVVILADILEHVSNPERVLKRLLELQPPGCIFIVSTPNIANISVRINLLFGRFDYQERGILDQTHLRYFTRRTLFKLLESSGIEILDCKATPVPLPFVHPFFESSVIGKTLYAGLNYLTKLFPTLMGYQFVIKARKPLA